MRTSTPAVATCSVALIWALSGHGSSLAAQTSERASAVVQAPSTAVGPAEASIVPDQPSAPQGWFFDVEGWCPTPEPDGLGSIAEISVGGVKIGSFGPQSSAAGVDRYAARLYLWPTIEPGPTTLSATCTSGATATAPFIVAERLSIPGAALAIDDTTPTGFQSVLLTGTCPSANEPVIVSWGRTGRLPGDVRGSLADVVTGPDGRFSARVKMSTSGLGPESFSSFCRNGASANVRITVVPPGAPDPAPASPPPAAPAARPTPGSSTFTG